MSTPSSITVTTHLDPPCLETVDEKPAVDPFLVRFRDVSDSANPKVRFNSRP
jgi:hypothetical protein